MSSPTLTAMINEAQTADDYALACMAMQQRIWAGHEVSYADMHHLAVKGHVIAERTGAPVSRAYMAVHRSEPETMVDNVSDDRG